MILFISDIDASKRCRKSVTVYFAAAVFCFIFMLIYEYFSHGVKSAFMIFAFLIPMAGGIFSAISYRLADHPFGTYCRQLLAGAVVWFTLGSIYQGVLEIYGTTNQLVVVFGIIGILQFLLAIIMAFLQYKSPLQMGEDRGR